jgi:hypothetical protein
VLANLSFVLKALFKNFHSFGLIGHTFFYLFIKILIGNRWHIALESKSPAFENINKCSQVTIFA